MIEFTDNEEITHMIPVREMRRLSFGDSYATVHIKGARWDAQIIVSLKVGHDIGRALQNKHIEG
jgi:hypothetical protein